MTHSKNLRQSQKACTLFLLQVVLYSGISYFARWRLPYGARLGPLTWTFALADGIQAWSVGVAGLVAIVAAKGSIRDLGLQGAAAKYFAIACALPIAYCTAIYLPCWLSGFASFKGPRTLFYATVATIVRLPWHVAMASGEEIGWRGALTPNLATLIGSGRAGLACGLAWATWHYADILFFDYSVGTPWAYAIGCFTVSLVGMSVFLTWLRLAGRSVWPPALFHGVHNAVIYGVFDRSTETDSKAALLTTEFGAGLALAAAVLGVAGWRELQRTKISLE